MEKFFKLGLRGTDKKTEIIAGLTTFMTMAYVLAVQPAAICGGEAYITDVNGVVITKSAIMITCALVSGLITLLMAFYTNFPFALSTGMGSNFILGALIQSQALSFGAAMVITLISGIVFVLLTVFGLRDLIVRVIPKNIKIAISASIGFFIAYLGFQNSGIGSFENGIALGNLADPAVLLAIGGLLLIIVLKPVTWAGGMITRLITPGNKGPEATEDDIRILARLSRQSGIIQPYEETAIRNILALDQKRVHDVMTPRTVVFSLPSATTVDEAQLLSFQPCTGV